MARRRLGGGPPGAEIVGFTVWSIFGAFDRNSLLTEWKGSYEPEVVVGAAVAGRTILPGASRTDVYLTALGILMTAG